MKWTTLMIFTAKSVLLILGVGQQAFVQAFSQPGREFLWVIPTGGVVTDFKCTIGDTDACDADAPVNDNPPGCYVYTKTVHGYTDRHVWVQHVPLLYNLVNDRL